jgi:hypothetical protein
MGQGSQGDRSQDKSFSHIGTYSYPYNHSYPHPHAGFPRHFIDPVRSQQEQAAFVNCVNTTAGVKGVTPGFMSNKNSTPPQFEYPALLQKQLKFENVQVVKTEKNKSNDD